MREKPVLVTVPLVLLLAAGSAQAKHDELYDRRFSNEVRFTPNMPRASSHAADLDRRSDGFGAVITGIGGLSTADSRLHEGVGIDSPDVLRDAPLRVEGERAVGGFATELLVRLSDVRLGVGTVLAFGDAHRLDAPPLPNGFTVQPSSTLIASVHAYIGRQLRIGPVLPYADVFVGASFLQTTVRLHHPSFGFLGETPHAAYRFALGPRIGVAIPLASIFFLDVGGRAEIFGFLRLTGYAGIGVFFGP